MGPKNSQTFVMLSSRLSFWGSGAPKKLSAHRIAAKKPKYFTRIGITKNSSTCTSGSVSYTHLEGMVIPDGSVAVGVPAKVIKQVSPAQVEANLHNAAHYVEHGRVHAAQCKMD